MWNLMNARVVKSTSATVWKRGAVRMICGIALAAALAVDGATAQSKGRVDKYPFSLTFSGVADCGTFEDHWTSYLDGFEIDFYDADGTLMRIDLHWTETSADVNSATGYTLNGEGRKYARFDLRAGTLIVNGVIWQVKVPGEGTVVHDIGRLLFGPDGALVFQAGRHDVLGTGDFDQNLICRLLNR